jgi:hypothetical protein
LRGGCLLLLYTRSGSACDALLEVSGTLGRSTGPLAQTLELARLREDEQ